LERREKLVSLADSWGVPIVEDDPYSQLRYEGDPIPPLIALDAIKHGGGKPGYGGSVLYHGTLSKLLAPGLRIGWVVAPHEVIQQLAALKQGIDLHTSTLTQMIAYEVARSGFLDQHIERLRAIYCHRRNVMLEAMESYLPAGVRWTRPCGGLFILVTLPSGIDAKEVLVKSLKRMVAFFPGEPFYPGGGGENTLRLNFSNAKPDRIVEGIRRLGEVLEPLCQA
jgi:2-aminoadipate transaminase